MNRICSLPKCLGPSEAEAEELQRLWVLPEAYAAGVRLLPGQVYGIYSWIKYGKVMSGMGVGQGKTLLTLMIATEWHRRGEGRNSLLLIPSSVHRQLWTRDIPWARDNFDVDLPIVSMGSRDRGMRRALAQAPGGRAFLLPYSLLSTRDTTELLRWINADLVIADEAHLLRGRSAKTKRFWDWALRWRTLEDGREAPTLVSLSGTLTARSVLDYYQIMKWSLTSSSALPLLVGEVEKWSEALDSGGARDNGRPTNRGRRAMIPLARWAEVEANARWRKAHFREAYRRRLESTPGYVPPTEGSIAAGLLIENVPVEGGPGEELTELMRGVQEDWTDPDGDTIMYALEKHERMRELSCGIYLRRYWPDRPGSREARDAWEAKQEWLRALRHWLGTKQRPPEGLDTPGLVNAALLSADQRAARLSVEVVETWQEWQVRERRVPEGAPSRQVEPLRLDDYKLQAAVDYAKGRKGSIIWYHHEEAGNWLEEEFRQRDLKVLRKRAGATWLHGDGSERYHCIASISAHCTGKNLQHHSDQLLYQPSRSSVELEQTLGRVHRVGQQADQVVVRMQNTIAWDHEQLEAALADTIYDQATLGGSRKLLVASWSPPPVLSV